MIADTARPQPPIQPIHGPNALVPQVNVVPQSGVSLRQLAVRERHQQHRDERQHEHRWRFVADRQDDVAQGGRQAVSGGHRREADDDVADETERAGLQALVTGRHGPAVP